MCSTCNLQSPTAALLTRLTHAAFAFAATAVTYQLYAVAIVPLVEPTHFETPALGTLSGGAGARPRAVRHKHRQLLASYFQESHWCLQKPPKTIESGHAMVVLDDYNQSEDGKLRISRCILIYFPNGRQLGAAPPRNAILLEAPHGAVLQMDDSLGPGPASFGRIQWGELQGRIRITSDMQAPGPDDDLLILTRDLRLNESGVSTRAAVEMRLGKHLGRGRGLEIRNLPKDQSAPQAGMLRGLESLEIASEVRVELDVSNVKFLQGPARQRELALASPAGKPEGTADKGPSESETPPVRIKCDGAFRFDFANNKASFLKNVIARQVHIDGKLDQLRADELNLYLTKQTRGDQQPSPSTARSNDPQQSLASGYQPGLLEARGSPVVLDAPSHEASMRGERLRIEIPERRITVDGGDEVSLSHRGSEIHAPMVQYRHPSQESQEKLGEVHAAGRGWLRAVVDRRRPHNALEVSWSSAMRLDRKSGQPVLSVTGRPRLEMPGIGGLMADQMHVFLRENPAVQPSNPAPAIAPERLIASGSVAIDSPELTGRVNQLTMWVQYEEIEKDPAPDDPPAGQTSGLLTSARSRRTNRRAYAINGNQLALLVRVRGGQADVSRVSVDGNVRFQESTDQRQTAPPLSVVARELHVEDADTPNAKITIVGAPAVDDRPAIPAEISAGSATLRAPSLQLNRGSSRAWINQPGEVQFSLERDFTGQALATPDPLTITWQDSMHLEGDRITFEGNVIARNSRGWLQTPQLIAQLSAPIRFDGASASQRPELAQIECRDGVLAEFQDRDLAGVTSHQRVELRTLLANQTTGRLEGDGPGRIESVHLGGRGNPLAKLGQQEGQTSQGDAGQRLRYLRTEFGRRVTGNLKKRQVTLHGNVRTVYGPVDAWEQKLNPAPGEEPTPNSVHIDCDRLTVAESPVGRLFVPPGSQNRMGPIELTAESRVTIEGRHPEQGAFTARGRRATYDQSKAMFVLEGGPNAPAKIWRQQYVGAPASIGSGQSFKYWLDTGKAEGQSFRWEFNELPSTR